MAFTPATIDKLAVSIDGKEWWDYDTTDTIATVEGVGYFNTFASQLNLNDKILVNASDNLAWYYVSAITDPISIQGVVTSKSAAAVTITKGTATPSAGSIVSSMIATDAVTTIKLADSAHGYGQQGMVNGTLTATAGSSALTIALKTLAGTDPSATDPVDFFFRNSTGTTGNYVRLRQTAAASLVVSSGSTLGVSSSTAFRLWVVGFSDSGTFRLGVINCSPTASGTGTGILYPLIEGLASATSEGGGGGADSAGVIYANANVTTQPMLILGYLEWNTSGLTAGTWTTSNLASIQLFGPGIKKPGDIVQTTIAVTTPNDSSSSATYVVSSATITITPTSAANPILVHDTGLVSNASAGRAIGVRLSRGNTANTNMIGSESGTTNSVGVTASACAVDAIDLPNTTSAQIYAVQYKSTAGGSVTFGASSANYLSATEIMG